MARGKPKSNAVLEQVRKDINNLRAEYDAIEAGLKEISIRIQTKEEAYQLIEKALARPKSTAAPGAGKKSKERKASIETEKETVTPVAVCAVPGCGKEFADKVHDLDAEGSHKFHFSIKTKGAVA